MSTTRTRDALSGVAAAALGLGVSELAAGIFGSLPSLFQGLGEWVIDIVPKQVKDLAIDIFGTNDKLALLVSIALVTLAIGAVVGVLARRRFAIAIVVFIGFGLIAALAAARDPSVSLGLAIIPAGLAAITSLVSLQWLYDRTPSAEADAATENKTSAAGKSRRAFLYGFGAVVGVAALSAGIGRTLQVRGKRLIAGRGDVALPRPAQALAPVPAAAELGVQGLSTVITPNQDFYRIDTAFSVPRVELEGWSVSVSGMVDRPYSLTYSDLLDLRMVERDITMSCVSNRVGGTLVGNARWLGVPLSEILDRAGVQEGADQLVGRAVDQFTVGFPTETVYDGRDAILAVGMNGEPLPFEHGFPARMVVAGLYGYVSATKWLSEIELTRWDDFDAYWVPRGWAKLGPIKTQSRIDTPFDGARVDAGTVTVAGVAWAPDRGISRVEVQLGEGADWVEAELSEALSKNTWLQWATEWAPTPGSYQIQVRATDGDGNTQTEEIRPPAPDGASGWHHVFVVVV